MHAQPPAQAPPPASDPSPVGPRNALTQVVILGASGDLTERKLVPALHAASCHGVIPTALQLVGVARRPWDDQQFRASLSPRAAQACDPATWGASWDHLMANTHYALAHLDDAADYLALARRLDELAPNGADRVFYLAVRPELFGPVAANLHAAGLLAQDGRWSRRVVVEKPFGRDLASALALNGQLLGCMGEDQLYRIDHYLGKETVQNLLVFRFRNSFFEPLWNSRWVELVQITVAEDLGMEHGRGGYYDSSGAIRDILANHMLQLLALVAMEPPGAITPKAIRDEKVKVLSGLRAPTAAGDPRGHIVRGQYAGYRQESGVAPDSQTETYIAVRTFIDNWRWGGVPFLLRTGKELPARFTSIQVQFRMPPTTLFGSYDQCHVRPNKLTLRIQPNEGIDLDFEMKAPGQGIVIRPEKLSFNYEQAFGDGSPDAYERLLRDVVIGDQSLFIRSDEVEAGWRWVDDLRAAMAGTELLPYARRTWGPLAAEDLFGPDEGRWATG